MSCNQATSFCLPVEDVVCKYAYRTQGTVCRSAEDPCDAPEVCSGNAATCPVDAYLPSGTICDANATPALTCTGNSTLCPLVAPGDVPVMDLTIGITGSCDDAVHDAVVASVVEQLAGDVNNTNDQSPDDFLNVTKGNCTEVNVMSTCLDGIMKSAHGCNLLHCVNDHQQVLLTHAPGNMLIMIIIRVY